MHEIIVRKNKVVHLCVVCCCVCCVVFVLCYVMLCSVGVVLCWCCIMYCYVCCYVMLCSVGVVLCYVLLCMCVVFVLGCDIWCVRWTNILAKLWGSIQGLLDNQCFSFILRK